MMKTELLDELDYHLRELRADLALIRSDLENLASAKGEQSAVRAWVQAEALLAHDLEVHFPRALTLLAVVQPSTVGSEEPQSGDAVTLKAMARVASELVAAALMSLSLEADPACSTPLVSSAARASAAAHRMLVGMQDLVSSSLGGDPGPGGEEEIAEGRRSGG